MRARAFWKTALVLAAISFLAPSGYAKPHANKAHKAAPAKGDADSTPTWKPDPTLLKQLGPYADMVGYQIRPPKGYTLEQKPVQTEKLTGTFFIWTSPNRKDKSQPALLVRILHPMPGYEPKDDDEILNFGEDILKDGMHNITQSSSEHGKIDDLYFGRNYCKGVDEELGTPMHGFTYCCIDDYAIIVINAADNEPYSQKTLPLMEAAAETFRSE